ncbi:MAG: hypothetical protein ABSF03_26050 [Streptosporangiaceae bacterium]
MPSRRRLFPTSHTIHFREPPRRFGSSPIGMPNVVAMTRSSRLALMAWPTISSDYRRGQANL